MLSEFLSIIINTNKGKIIRFLLSPHDFRYRFEKITPLVCLIPTDGNKSVKGPGTQYLHREECISKPTGPQGEGDGGEIIGKDS